MSVNFEYSSGAVVSTTRFADFPARRVAVTRRLICLAVLCLVPTLVLAADALRTLPRAEECIDVARLNSVSEAERAVLRIEWRAGLARAEESRLLNEMYERIERLQKTTNDIRVLMNAIPSPNERAAANNSPSGLGPSARIPPVATPVRATAALVVKTPTVETALVSTTAPTATQTAVPTPIPPAAPVAVPQLAPVTTPTTPVPQVPVPAPWAKTIESSQSPEPPKSSVAIAIPEIPAVKMNQTSLGQLFGVGLVSVALVVLWWMRRRDGTPRAWGEGGLDTVPHANVQGTSGVTPKFAPEFAPTEKNEISEAPQFAQIFIPTSPVTNVPPPVVGNVDTDTDQHEKTLIIQAYQPSNAPAPSPDIPAETVAPEVAVATAEMPLEYVPAAPPAPPMATMPPAPAHAVVNDAPASNDKPADTAAQSEESILELAEMMLSMGLATGAAQKLVEHIRANPKSALAHWLKLLEIYRENGQRSNFEQAARQLQQEFNIRASDWMRGTTDRPRLEKFDRVFSQIESLWNHPAQCIAFLSGMLHDNRDGQRVGFPQEVAEEILLLIEILQDTSGLSEIDAKV